MANMRAKKRCFLIFRVIKYQYTPINYYSIAKATLSLMNGKAASIMEGLMDTNDIVPRWVVCVLLLPPNVKIGKSPNKPFIHRCSFLYNLDKTQFTCPPSTNSGLPASTRASRKRTWQKISECRNPTTATSKTASTRRKCRRSSSKG